MARRLLQPEALLAGLLALGSWAGAGCFFDLAVPVEVGTNPPVILATSQQEPWAVAVDSTTVYWTNVTSRNPSSGTLVKVVKDKSSGTATLASGQIVGTVALDETHVYWTGRMGSDGRVLRMPKDGTSVEYLAMNQSDPVGLAIDATTVYWTDSIKGMVLKRAKNDPAAMSVVVASAQQRPWLLALGATDVYWTNRSGQAVMRAAKDGSTPPQLVAPALGDVFGIAVDDTWIFWRDAGAANQGRVMRAALDGSHIQQLATTTGEGPRFLAIDQSNVYWTSGTDTEGSIMTGMKEGGGIIALATGQAGPRGIAVDDTDVYWSNFSGATIMKVSKMRTMRFTSRGGP
ncbi:MAG TPA: hypothetical protein VFH73_16315 [Polyangia bacterium]|jgi:hypothetical protein|nr:hypothetical protein [Polyangia bacterium]